MASGEEAPLRGNEFEPARNLTMVSGASAQVEKIPLTSTYLYVIVRANV